MSRRISISDSWKLYRNSLNYPLYVPTLGDRIEKSLIDGDLDGFHRELRRFAALGSRPASALLGYLYLRGAFKGGPRPDLAETHSVEGAKEGDPFSQYVLAWSFFNRGRRADATNWMLKSATSGDFLPAIVDSGVWMASGSGFKAPDAPAGLKTLWLAQKKGHRFAIAYIAQMFLRGRFGIIGRIVAIIVFPLLILWGALATLLWPFSAKTFAHNPQPRGPLFKVPIDAEKYG